MLTHPTSITEAIDSTLVLVLAGGKGSRLHGLTQERAKPALEFGGHSSLIDFTLSNCLNSGFPRIGVITQYQSQCLIQHLMKNWGFLNHTHAGRLDILPAYSNQGVEGYAGTADACYKNATYIRESKARYVLILSGDHIYQMDYRKLLQTHLQTQADMTVSCIEVPQCDAASKLGVVCTNKDSRIIDFHEKPAQPCELDDLPGYSLASMGVYLVNADYLIKTLASDALLASSSHDFGKDVIPRQLNQARLFAHRFRGKSNQVTPYWRDVGTLDSFWQAHMDLLRSPAPIIMEDPAWPLRGRASATAGSMFTLSGNSPCELSSVLLGAQCHLDSCRIKQSVVSTNCVINQDASLNECVLLPDVTIGKGVALHRVIVDKGCTLPPGLKLDTPEQAKALGLTVTDNRVILLTQSDIDEKFSQVGQSLYG